MKTRARILLAVGLLALLATPAVHANPGDLRPSIPFEFTAGGKTLPSGTYTVSRSSVYSGVLDIRDNRGGVFLVSPAEESGPVDGTARLVFHRYGTRSFLREVWFGGRRGYNFPASMEEREASMTPGGRQAAKPEVIAVQAASLGR